MTAHPTPTDPASEAVSALELGPVPPKSIGDLRVMVRDCIGQTVPLRRRWVSAIMERVVTPLLADIAALRTRAEEAERERDEARSRNGNLALQLRDEKLKRVTPPSALLARAEAAEALSTTLAAELAESRAEVARLRDALKPFVDACDWDDGRCSDAHSTGVVISFGAFRAAARALKPEGASDAR